MSDATATEDDDLDGDFWVVVDHVDRRVAVGGELDCATTPTMIDAIAALQGIRSGDITLDLQAVTFPDAGALGALVHLRQQQLAQHASLSILGNTKITRLATLFALPWLTTPHPADDEFDRYKQASIDQQRLQAERGKLGRTDDDSPEESQALDKIDVALELAGVELDAARAAYLREPRHAQPNAAERRRSHRDETS